MCTMVTYFLGLLNTVSFVGSHSPFVSPSIGRNGHCTELISLGVFHADFLTCCCLLSHLLYVLFSHILTASLADLTAETQSELFGG